MRDEADAGPSTAEQVQPPAQASPVDSEAPNSGPGDPSTSQLPAPSQTDTVDAEVLPAAVDTASALRADLAEELSAYRASVADKFRGLFGGTGDDGAEVAVDEQPGSPRIWSGDEPPQPGAARFKPVVTTALVNLIWLLFAFHWLPHLPEVLGAAFAGRAEPLAALLLLSPGSASSSWWQLDALKVRKDL